MKAKEFFKAFRMKAEEMEEISGYSRQTFYNIFNGKTGVNERRMNSVISNLLVVSKNIYNADILEANRQKKIRENVLNELKKLERLKKGE